METKKKPKILDIINWYIKDCTLNGDISTDTYKYEIKEGNTSRIETRHIYNFNSFKISHYIRDKHMICTDNNVFLRLKNPDTYFSEKIQSKKLEQYENKSII